jgi:hypothetical protein
LPHAAPIPFWLLTVVAPHTFCWLLTVAAPPTSCWLLTIVARCSYILPVVDYCHRLLHLVGCLLLSSSYILLVADCCRSSYIMLVGDCCRCSYILLVADCCRCSYIFLIADCSRNAAPTSCWLPTVCHLLHLAGC